MTSKSDKSGANFKEMSTQHSHEDSFVHLERLNTATELLKLRREHSSLSKHTIDVETKLEMKKTAIDKIQKENVMLKAKLADLSSVRSLFSVFFLNRFC